jgi:hypothetical protein
MSTDIAPSRSGLYLIFVEAGSKAGLWYKPNRDGYTNDPSLAGLYRKNEAIVITKYNDNLVAIPADQVLEKAADETAARLERIRERLHEVNTDLLRRKEQIAHGPVRTRIFLLNETYRRRDGETITVKSHNNLVGYETFEGSDGVWRYDRPLDRGRTTGTAPGGPLDVIAREGTVPQVEIDLEREERECLGQQEIAR